MLVTCCQLTEMITDRREGALSSEQEEGCAQHLSWCERCRTYLRQMDLTIHALRGIPGEPLHDEVRAALFAQFQRRKTTAD
ncbi:anti-sigma factor family protein [Sorangium sp. So ce1097]|uniref:anti-sigma factor family protein n=1 Tax=Sorangium sp. So ce1097 TaxID=3133330 RepID=UPI003F5F7996